jgi:hypothetical protein
MGINRGRVAFGLGASAVGWALLLVAAAFVFPAYHGETCGSGGCTSTSSTLYAENGWWVVALLGGIAVVAAGAFYELHLVCSRASERAATFAKTSTVVVVLFAVVSAASIGLFVFPVALFLAASTALTLRARAPRGS